MLWCGGEENKEMVKGTKLQLYKTEKSGGLVYSIMAILNTTILYSGNVLRE